MLLINNFDRVYNDLCNLDDMKIYYDRAIEDYEQKCWVLRPKES